MKNNTLFESLKIFDNTFLLRLAVAVILLIHGLGGMFNGGVNQFGNAYLNEMGFAPLGLYIAWAIKLSHVAAAVCLLFKKYIKLASIITIFVLIMGIIMVHAQHGWFVVGDGRNGVEFNFLLIFALLTFIFPRGINNSSPGYN